MRLSFQASPQAKAGKILSRINAGACRRQEPGVNEAIFAGLAAGKARKDL
jgi:hypothetical protein